MPSAAVTHPGCSPALLQYFLKKVWTFVHKCYLKICVFERQSWSEKWRCSQSWLVLRMTTPQDWEGSPTRVAGAPALWAFFCFSKHISRGLPQKWSSWVSVGALMECQHLRWWLDLLCLSASPCPCGFKIFKITMWESSHCAP